MQDLRELLSNLGFQNIQTYIQSGNIILSSKEDKSAIILKIEENIFSNFGYNVPVLIRTIDEWKKAIDANPYANKDPKRMCFTFLNDIPTKTTFEVNGIKEDEFTIIDDVVYIYAPSGFGKTKLTNNLFERKLNVTATSRNFRTTLKLLELSSS